jgi:VWFA-related protein
MSLVRISAMVCAVWLSSQAARPSITIAMVVGGAQTPPQTFTAAADVVSVYPLVLDRAGQFVTDLTKGDFQILDSGRPAEIVLFDDSVQPLTLALLLDASQFTVYVVGMQMRAIEPGLNRLRDASRSFFDMLLPADRVRIGTIGGEIALSPHLTNDRAILNRILDEELWEGGARPIWSGMHSAMTSLQRENGRRVLLLLSFGPNDCVGFSGRCENLKSVRERVAREGFLVYAIDLQFARMDSMLQIWPSYREGLHVDDPGGPGYQMKLLADESGGRSLVIKNRVDIPSTLQHVADELHHQYVLGFRPTRLDGKTHTVEVRTVRSDLQVRARRTYVATR